MTKRIFALILVLLMVVPFAACGANDAKQPANTPDGETTAAAGTTAPAATEPAYKPNLPEVRYDGEELVIVQRFPDQSTYPEVFLYSEGYDGDILNDAVFKRNLAIEEKYGITLTNAFVSSPNSAIGTAVQAQSDEYDVGFPQMGSMGSNVTSGFYYNLHNLDYVDFSQPYWDSNFDQDMTLYGKLYAMVSDISLMTLVETRGIIFNRDLAKENNLEDPYDLVHNNQWTLDKMIEMAHAVSADLNGDQIYDDMDQYGMLTEASNFRYMIIASDIDIFTRNADGDPILAYTSNEKTISVVEKFRSIYNDETHAIAYESLGNTAGAAAAGSKWVYGRQLFSNGQILFVQNSPNAINEIVANGMEDEYGIVPNPKYDSDQERYYHSPDPNTTVLAIPSTNDDYERLGILLEDMAYFSSQTVLPAYYETIMKVRRAPVPEMAEMVDIIKNTITYNLSATYAVDAFAPLDSASASGNIASAFRVGANRVNALIKKACAAVKELP